MATRSGLVLVGGGARGAYQAGVLRGLGEIVAARFGARPFFDVITGISAGGINASFLASHAADMRAAVERLDGLWRGIHLEEVMKTDVRTFAGLAVRWLRELGLGGASPVPRARTNYLLDTTPLRAFLARHVDCGAISANLARGVLHGFAVSATNYRTGTAVTFFDGAPEIAEWVRSARLGRRAHLGLEHILASAAIPLLFRPVEVDGVPYGDGGIRLSTPLSPAIHLGADRVLAISIRHPRARETTEQLHAMSSGRGDGVSVADIAGVMLNAAFLDGLDSDAERMTRINQTLALIDEKRRGEGPALRPLPLLVIYPSADLGALAAEQFTRFPRALQYMMKGIGASEAHGSDLTSYLAFDPAYTRPLLDMGRADALARREEIEAFFAGG